MAIGIGATASGSVYTPLIKRAGLAHSDDPVQAAQRSTRTQAAVAEAQQALANANGIVDQDKRNQSPGCVACDQKLVDKAQVRLTQAKASESDQASQTQSPPGSAVDFSV